MGELEFEYTQSGPEFITRELKTPNSFIKKKQVISNFN